MKTIQLTRGMVAIVDDDDYDHVTQFSWYAIKRRRLWHAAHKRTNKPLYMHRVLLNAPPDMEVDHANGDGLDNRRHNLRLCTKRQNAQNRRSGAKGKSESVPCGNAQFAR